ncbi:MAG: RND transporter, partial [Acidobacteriota bacterium]
NRAVRTQGNQKIVTVLYKGQQITTPIGLGLENDTMAEITSGLQEGDVVVLNQTQTRQTTAGGGIGIPGLGGLGGR